MAPYSRIAFAQIAANPAFLDESGNSLLHEPVLPSDEEIGLYTLGALEEINHFRNKVAEVFTTHISTKIETAAASRPDRFVRSVHVGRSRFSGAAI